MWHRRCATCLGWLTGVLFLVLDPYNKNRTVRFHAFQSIFLNVGIIAVYIVLAIFSAILIHLFRCWAFCSHWFMWSSGSACSLLWVFLMYKAYNKEKFVIPVIGPLAEKQAGA